MTIGKGDRVIVTTEAGEEGATVESVDTVDPAFPRVTLQMDDRTRFSCGLASVRPE